MTIAITSTETGVTSWSHEAVAGDGFLVVFAWYNQPFDPMFGTQAPVASGSYGSQAFDIHNLSGNQSGVAENLGHPGGSTIAAGMQVLRLAAPPAMGVHTITLVPTAGVTLTGAVSYMLSGTSGPPAVLRQTGAGGSDDQHTSYILGGTQGGGNLGSNGGSPDTTNFILGAMLATGGGTLDGSVTGQSTVDTFGDVSVIQKYPSDPVFFTLGGWIDFVQWTIDDAAADEAVVVSASIILAPSGGGGGDGVEVDPDPVALLFVVPAPVVGNSTAVAALLRPFATILGF